MVTEIVHKNILQRVIGGMVGVLFGLVLFFGSFVLLFWNEGRLNIGKYVDSNAVMVDVVEGSDLAYVTGDIKSSSRLGDTYLRESTDYIAVQRVPEIYAWEEIVESESKTELGGSETTTKQYIYKMKWLSNPRDSSLFKEPEGHENPQFTFSGANLYSPSASIEGYTFDSKKTNIPFSEVIFLTGENVIETNGFALQGNQFLYNRAGASSNAKIGDVRIYYEGVEANKIGTIFGAKENNAISIYDPEDKKVLHLRYGNFDMAVETLKSEHSTTTWIFRGLGFLAMWIGMVFLLRPLAVVVSIIPILGTATDAIAGFITFFIALALSIITIIISIIFHNILLLIGTVIITIGIIIYVTNKSKK